MGHILQHARAKTTPFIRKQIKDSPLSPYKLAKKYNITYNTARKWKEADNIYDKSCANKTRRGSLSELEEKVICIFRKTTLLSLDDCYIALKDEINSLTRSNLHRCLQRNDLSDLKDLLPKSEEKKKKKFKEYELGFVHIDIADINISSGKFYLFVSIERLSKMVYAKIYKNKTIKEATDFLNETIKYFPFKIHRILTDNGAQFTYRFLNKELRPKDRKHEFKIICQKNGISHRETKFRHPWTNGQVERFNRSLKDAMIKKYYYPDLESFTNHLDVFITSYNYGKKLKALKFQTPIEKLIDIYKNKSKLFYRNPFHNAVGLNS
jgi:transposase-like protein